MMRGPIRTLVDTPEEKAKDQRQVLTRLLGLLKPYRGQVMLAFGMVILSATTQGLGPYLIGLAVDDFISQGDRSGLATIVLFLAGVYLVNMVATRFQIFWMAKAGQNLLADLREHVFRKLQRLSLQYLEGKQAGELISRLINDIDALSSFFSQSLTQMIGAIFSIIGIMVAMLAINWRLGLAVLVVVPVLWVVTRLFSAWARMAFRKTRTTIGDVSANLEEELGGVKIAQAFSRTDENVRRFAERNAANRDANISANAVTSAFAPAMDILSALDLALVAALGGWFVVRGVASLGTMIAFIQYVQNFFRPIQTVAQLWTSAQSAFAAAERVFELLDVEEIVTDFPDAEPIEEILGRVTFENVSFSYSQEDEVLRNVSFTVEAGQRVAIVGPTGAGKTTIIGLIARFYDPQSGTVRIDGKNVRYLKQRSLRAQMGMVSQEPFLFSGTIFENIRYGRLDASEEEVVIAAQAANANEFISRQPEGYQTDVGERGKLLSQGQRQLISIARAILANPRILIMDEATASIDTRTELLITKAMGNLLSGRTSFIIAHRLSTVRNADLVLVIDNGEIVESGTHANLIEAGKLYSDLYRRQFFPLEKLAG